MSERASEGTEQGGYRCRPTTAKHSAGREDCAGWEILHLGGSWQVVREFLRLGGFRGKGPWDLDSWEGCHGRQSKMCTNLASRERTVH